jgi:hypothetical protein
MESKKRNSIHITQENDTLTIAARVSIQQAKAWINGTAIAIGSGMFWVLSHLPFTPPAPHRVLPSEPTEQIDKH